MVGCGTKSNEGGCPNSTNVKEGGSVNDWLGRKCSGVTMWGSSDDGQTMLLARCVQAPADLPALRPWLALLRPKHAPTGSRVTLKKKRKQGQGMREGLKIGDDAGRNTYTSGSESSVMRLLATLLWSPSDSSLWKRGSSSGVLMMGMSGMGGTF